MSRAERLYDPSALKEPRRRIDVDLVRQSILEDARGLLPPFLKRLNAQEGLPASIKRKKVRLRLFTT